VSWYARRVEHNYDVIIVGGRPAGSSLGARLGAAGLNVLIVERATFPSGPAVSAPFLLPHAMALLDEIGADEAQFAESTPQLRRFVLELADYFRVVIPFDAAVGGRNYFYTVDRQRLDTCLWRGLSRWPNVHTLADTKVIDLARDADGGVVGVVVEDAAGQRRELRGRAVIGADGRFSLVARKVDAQTTESRDDVATTIYFDTWHDVARYDDEPDPIAHIHGSCDGFSFVFMPTSEGRMIVLAQGRADAYAALEGEPDAIYESLLRARPHLWWRLAQARRCHAPAGMKRVGNTFRTAAGPGWALVGDAYHQKDSIDAQGIYDALLGAKLLAEQLVAWSQGHVPWDIAMARYSAAIYAACKPMFDATMGRLQREIYSVPPPAVAKTMMRWMITHPDYGRRYAALVTRQLAPSAFLPPRTLLSLAARGAWQRLRRKLTGSDPTDPRRP
jgi:2-polyprenyl-6-methoxyphenol hydroxylase-like FAD-dependent oxidoreductase